MRSLGTNTSSKMTKPSGVFVLPDTGKSRVSSWRGAYVVLMIFTPGAFTGTIAAMAYSSSPAFIDLVGIVIRSWPSDAAVMCSLAPRMTTPSGLRSTTWT